MMRHPSILSKTQFMKQISTLGCAMLFCSAYCLVLMNFSCRKAQQQVVLNSCNTVASAFDSIGTLPLSLRHTRITLPPKIIGAYIVFAASPTGQSLTNPQYDDFVYLNRITLRVEKVFSSKKVFLDHDSVSVYQDFLFYEDNGRLKQHNTTTAKTIDLLPNYLVYEFRMIGDNIIGILCNQSDTTTSLFAYNINSRQLRMVNTIKCDPRFELIFTNLQPLVTTNSDTIICYNRRKYSNVSNHGIYGSFSLTRNYKIFEEESQHFNSRGNLYTLDEYMYTLSGHKIFCYDATNGNNLWTHVTDGWNDLMIPLGDVIITKVDNDYGIQALNRKTGKSIWHNRDIRWVFGPHAQYTAMANSLSIIAINAQDNTYLHELDLSTGCVSKVAKAFGRSIFDRLFADSVNNKLFIIDPNFHILSYELR